LILLGVLNFIRGGFVAGLWWALIGMFLRNASQMSYQKLLIRRALEGEKVSRFMKPEAVTVTADLSVDELVQDYIYKYHYKMFPMMADGQLRGCVTTQEIKEVPKDEWGNRTVNEIAKPCSSDNTISADADAVDALATMNRSHNSRLIVVEDDYMVGIVSLKDLLGFLSLKMDLEPQHMEGMKIPSGKEL
jgi:predicted transcriptional regulator